MSAENNTPEEAEPPVSKARLYSAEWYSCDGFTEGEIRATVGDGYWPGMVLVELSGIGSDSIGMTLTVDDARDLANHINAAAASSEVEMRALTQPTLSAPEVSPSSSSRPLTDEGAT